MAYNPYNAVKKISELKGKYHDAKAQGKDPTQYHLDAVQYYNELRDNNYSKVADELTLADYTESLDILSGFNQPTDYDYLFEDYSRQAKSAYTPEQSKTVEDIMAAYNQAQNTLYGPVTTDSNGNIITGQDTAHYNKGMQQLDYINNYDITAQPWYEGIMSQYNLLGDNAAKGQLASGASSNSGNIDSYAAANANRQQLAFTNAAQQAALQTAAQNMGYWQTLYDSIGGRLTDKASQAGADLATGATYYQQDSLERQNALNKAADLQKAAYQGKIDEILAQLEGKNAVDLQEKVNEATKETARQNYEAAARQALAQENAASTQWNAQKDIAQAERDAAEAASAAKETATSEQDMLSKVYADMHSFYNMYRSKQNGITSLADVYQAALGLYPEHEKEIKEYIETLKSLDSIF